MIALAETVELRQHLPQIVAMLSSKVCLLRLASAAPDPTFTVWTINDGIICQQLILLRHEEAAGTNDAVGGYGDGVVYTRLGVEGVPVADLGAFDTASYLEQVVVTDAHDLLASGCVCFFI
jgi:hypothetical protein